MATQSFEKITCPKCQRTYVIVKGSDVSFTCMDTRCGERISSRRKEVKRENVQ